jgi:polar amino acid transport system substrate-binding protein
VPGGPERLKRVRLLAAGAILSLVVTACSSSSGGGTASSSAAPTVTKDAALAALVPADVSSDSKLIIGTDASYAPNEFTDTDGKTIIGMDVDLGTAVAQKLGLTAEFQNSAFDGIIPGIQAGKYEAGMSSFSITDERVKTVDMVSYFSSGTRLGTLKGNPEGLSVDNLCGKNVAVQRGTTQVDDLAKRTKTCTDGGKPAINVTEYQLQTDVNLALVSKRASAMLADAPVVGYAQKTTNGEVEALGAAYDTAPYGVVLPKAKGQLAKAVQGAIQALISDGTYKRILDKWGVGDGAIPTSEIRS